MLAVFFSLFKTSPTPISITIFGKVEQQLECPSKLTLFYEWLKKYKMLVIHFQKSIYILYYKGNEEIVWMKLNEIF